MVHVKPLCHSRYFKTNFFRCVIALSDFTHLFAAKRHDCSLQSNAFGSSIGVVVELHHIKHRLLSSFSLRFLPELFAGSLGYYFQQSHSLCPSQYCFCAALNDETLCIHSFHMTFFLRIFQLHVFLDMKNIVCAAPPRAISS
jgi:hypothetical protein